MAFQCLLAILFLIGVAPCQTKNTEGTGDLATEQLFQRLERSAAEEHVQSRRQCTHSARERRNADRLPRLPRGTGIRGNAEFGTALYFSGQSDFVRRSVKSHLPNPIGYPTEQFTVELWVKPEGGQRSPAVIIGKFIENVQELHIKRCVQTSTGLTNTRRDISINNLNGSM